jgi:hypothetical protein
MKRKHKQVILISLGILCMLVHIASVLNGTVMTAKEVDKAVISSFLENGHPTDSKWTLEKEQELKKTVYAVKGLEIFPDSIKMKYYNCILSKAKVRILDADINNEANKQTVINISKECALECDMDYRKYK